MGLGDIIRYVIVLGNRLQYAGIHDELQGRMDIGIEVFQKTASYYLVVSGGITNPGISQSESAIMKDYAEFKGIPTDQILIESKSLDTIGNGFFTGRLLQDAKTDSELFVITSCYHVNRSRYIFQKCFSPKIKLNFDYCYPATCSDNHEEGSLKLAEDFFSGISPGDLDLIEMKLKNHPLYKK